MTSVLNQIADQFVASLGSTVTGAGELIHLPIGFADGDVASVYVERLDADRYLATDLGDSAARLALFGVDLTRDAVLRSWTETVRGVDRAQAVMAPIGNDFEIATVCDADHLGATVMRVGETMIRAEGLAAFAPSFRPKTFASRLVRRVAEFDLTVIPDAEMPSQFGAARRVTCEIKATGREVFTQALSRAGDRNRAYDHVRSLFTDAATSLRQDQKVVVVQQGIKLPTWQMEALGQSNVVVNEERLDAFLEHLVA